MKFIKSSLCVLLSAAMLAINSQYPGSFGANPQHSAVKYEFEAGKTNGGKIYNETWKGNTAEDGTGEEYDLTNASGGGFSYLDQKGTTVSVEVTVPECGLYELTIC